MINRFCKKPLWACSRKLADVAEGRAPADTVITGAKFINVCTHEIQDGVDVAIADGRVAMTGNCAHCIGKSTQVIDAAGKYIAPAFTDAHIHVESSMLTACEYAKAVIPHGTCGIFMDPHEICNVLGLDGVRWMLDDAAKTPLKAMLTTPSCVPAVPGFEDTGAAIGPEEVKQTMDWKECVGLGEMMNFPGVLASDERTHAIIGETLKSGNIVTGHYSMPETDRGLNAYIASGVRCCHESTRDIDALEKMRRGMYALIREGSAWHDLHEVCKAITQYKVDSRFACLISDDTHPHTLMELGHVDHLVRRAIEEGVDPVTAIQMVTINPAQCFQLDHELGSVAPGKCADIVLIDDLEKCRVTDVFIDGEYVAKNGAMTCDIQNYVYPAAARSSMHVSEKTPDDFEIRAQSDKKQKVHVMEIIPARVGTFDRVEELTPEDGLLKADPKRDILKVFVFERHNFTGKFGYGFVKGFNIKDGALAQTVAHDAHNLLVIGTNDDDMALAANTLIKSGGGMAAVRGGKILAHLPLPIAGLMSDKTLEETSVQVEQLEKAWKQMGCAIPSPFMTMALIPLACLPELRLTDRGLVDCRTFSFTNLFVDAQTEK